MARALRIEFLGVIYHVTAHGNAREAIFRDHADRDLFLDTLGEVVTRFALTLLEGKGERKEIPRAQRWAHRPGLKSLFSARVQQDKPARDAAMRRECLEYGYTMAAVAREAGIHYSTVHRFTHCRAAQEWPYATANGPART